MESVSKVSETVSELLDTNYMVTPLISDEDVIGI
jgi:hypothetical protein